jgi:hypothetical protein
MYDSEVIPPSYTLYRNDRADGYGGILLAVKSDITSSEYRKSKNIEFIAAKIQLSKQEIYRENPKRIYVSFYFIFTTFSG